MIDTPQELLLKRRSPLTVKVLRAQLGQVPDDCVVEIGGVAMSQASHGMFATRGGHDSKLRITFVPLNQRSCGCGIGKRDTDCRLHREGP